MQLDFFVQNSGLWAPVASGKCLITGICAQPSNATSFEFCISERRGEGVGIHNSISVPLGLPRRVRSMSHRSAVMYLERRSMGDLITFDTFVQ